MMVKVLQILRISTTNLELSSGGTKRMPGETMVPQKIQPHPQKKKKEEKNLKGFRNQ